MTLNTKEHQTVQKIIGRPPSWILRWGILIVLLFFVLASLLAWVIRLPDVIVAPVSITTEAPPMRVVMPTNGQIANFFKKDKDVVQKGELLVIIENPANWNQILAVDGFCKNWTPQKNIPDSLLSNNLKLGAITPTWLNFVQHYQEKNLFFQNDISSLKIQNINQQIASFEELNTALLQQKETLKSTLALTQKGKERDEQLFAEKAASIIEVEQSTAAYLAAKQRYEMHSNSIITNNLKIEQLRAQILDLQFTQKNTGAEKSLHLGKDIQQISTAINAWKKAHLIEVPSDGTLSFIDNWRTQQYIAAETPIMTIIPNERSDDAMIAIATLGNHRFGKIKTGFPVNIELAAYPYQEFGVLKGVVQEIAPIAENGTYKVHIKLPNKLVTTYNQSIPFRQEMQGTAKIITEKRRLAEKLFDRIWSALKNN